MGKSNNTTQPEDSKVQAIQEPHTPETDPSGAPEVTTPKENPKLPEDTVTVNSPTGLNLRDGPGTSFHVLDTLPDGARLTVLLLPEGAEVPGFALVRYEGAEDGPLVGWVNTDYIRED